jgi:hypothetical protein
MLLKNGLYLTEYHHGSIECNYRTNNINAMPCLTTALLWKQNLKNSLYMQLNIRLHYLRATIVASERF